MKDIIKETIQDILLDKEDYFLTYCINKNWNKLYSIDKIKLSNILDNQEWSFNCEKTMINEMVYSIIINFDNELQKEFFLNYENENIKVKNIQIFINKKDILKLKTTLFKDDKDDFWDIK